MGIQETYDYWRANVRQDQVAELERLATNPDELADAFRKELEFGTAGLRGILGLGPNRMNEYTVGKATQGLADYLNATCEEPSVAIARDSRLRGEEFVRVCARVLAANGVKAYLYPRIEPTPALSFAVRYLGCSAGVNMTASHNPSAYNGYKAYGPDGCQITTQAAKAIQDAINRTDPFAQVKTVDFDQAVADGMIQWMGEDVIDAFVDAVAAVDLEPADAPAADLDLVYTPLNGTGLECVSAILKRVGIADLDVVPEQSMPDGNFPTCPYPNPEIREALELGLARCAQVRPYLLLATDPDADRVGIAARHGDEYVLVSGNEMGALLLDYLCARRRELGLPLDESVAITTIVSSAMIDAMAEDYGFQLRRTLTGFKYIGEQIGLMEAAGRADRFLFGFEESYGYLAGTHVRDKDAVVASMLIVQMARWHQAQGRDLIEAVDGLYQRYGYYRNKTLSFSYPGAAGAERMDQIMGMLHQEPPSTLAGLAVERVVDYAQGAEMPVVGALLPEDQPQQLPAANVVEFQLEGGNKIIVRPSGTEPKIKAYLFAKQADAAQADQLLADFEAAARDLLA
ncbi:MAG: phospho-sugar mutase [Coriobacteriia bacterium]|nr:phospho-sugar mutase [Coriobacteriia bacterium]